jgi:hypothetical protein
MSPPSTSAQRPEMGAAAVPASRRWLRYMPLAIGALSMAFGFYTGLMRLGVELPGGARAIADFHAAFMISGFLGTVICLERAVALGRTWPYAAPLLSSLGAIALVAGAPRFGALAFAAAGGTLLAASASIAIRQFALFTLVLTVGTGCWIVGTAQWLLGGFTPAVTGWWLDFLILTVAAERLELSRMRVLSLRNQIAFAGAVLLLLLGGARGEFAKSWAPLTAAGLIACAAWLVRYDVARRTVRVPGLPRFSAIAILIGHGWLGVAGLLLVLAPPGATAFSYDASVHAVTIGFVLSMIFGHAPIILPAVTGVRVRYGRAAYAPLILLHVSLFIRIAGDLLEQGDLRVASGFITIVALAAYAAVLLLASTERTPRRTV